MVDPTYPITFTSGAVTITVHNDFRPEIIGDRERFGGASFLTMPMAGQNFQQEIGIRIAGCEVIRESRTDYLGTYPNLTALPPRVVSRMYVHAVSCAVSGLLSLRAARDRDGVRLHLSGISGPSLRLVLEHVADPAAGLVVEPVLRGPIDRNTDRYDEYGNRLHWETKARFDPVPLDDFERSWRAYAEHVRLTALDAVPELVDHTELGRWYREGNAAIDAGWAPIG